MLEQTLLNLERFLNGSPIIGVGVSFLAGVLSSLSPCIYPLIPITLGIVGAAHAVSRSKGFVVSSLFVLGVALTYTTLGVIASAFGILLSIFFINPVTYVALALILITLGLYTLDIIKVNIPLFAPTYNSRGNKLSVFILGIVSGFALIPCNIPVMGAILSIISLKKDIFYGGTCLFVFSLGYGVPLIILGTFASLIRRLPKQGLWLIMIKKGIGGLLIFTGIYFLVKFINILR
ncbi:MAG: cytochrome c biogenesis protein CcdA [Candidatus Omnitrophica bacterium]|nr:cytochrome c biogenesis protein CcdA [Candidatus Omnitrophota bacterium]